MENQKEMRQTEQQRIYQEHYQAWFKNLSENHKLIVESNGNDVYSVSLMKIAYWRHSIDKDRREAALKEQADLILKKLTFLSEHFKLLEMDRVHQRALLRSESPYQTENRISYFEILLKQGHFFQMTRVKNENHRIREIPFVLPWEIADRLIQFVKSLL